MTRHVAFLRGVNLGRRQTKSADLVKVFEGLGYSGVKTLIASGNVLFDTDSPRGLQAAIEGALGKQFGFDIGVVLRSIDELRAMIAADPFGKVDAAADVARHVLMFAQPLKPKPKLADVPGDYEVARIDTRDIYFVVHKKPDGTYLGRSALGEVDKLLAGAGLSTMRNWNTIEKAAGK